MRLHNWICEHSFVYHKHAHANVGCGFQTSKNLPELSGVSFTRVDVNTGSVPHSGRYCREVFCNCVASETSSAYKEKDVDSIGVRLARFLHDRFHPIFLDKRQPKAHWKKVFPGLRDFLPRHSVLRIIRVYSVRFGIDV